MRGAAVPKARAVGWGEASARRPGWDLGRVSDHESVSCPLRGMMEKQAFFITELGNAAGLR